MKRWKLQGHSFIQSLEKRIINKSKEYKMKKKAQNEIIESPYKNPNNWKGNFYVNNKDPRIIVPKITPSLGWTLNFGHKTAYIAILGIILIIIAYQFLVSK